MLCAERKRLETDLYDHLVRFIIARFEISRWALTTHQLPLLDVQALVHCLLVITF